MIPVRAAVNLPRLPREAVAIVDETDPRVKRRIRGGLLIPLDQETPPEPEEAEDD